jgi:acetyl-CoA acetyltransferase
MSIRGTAAIVGAAQLDTFSSTGRSPLGLMSVAVTRALADAGLSLADVDGLFTASSYYAFPTLTLAENLGIYPRHMDSTALGGCSFIAQLGHAAAAIQAGLCDVAVIAYGSTQKSDAGKLVSMAESSVYEQPYGLIHPIGAFGMVAHRHMAEFGTTSEQLAQYAVSAREWALLTDTAPYWIAASLPMAVRLLW